MKTESEKIQAAIELAVQYGGIDGAHWVIDQMVRILAGPDEYERIVGHWPDGWY